MASTGDRVLVLGGARALFEAAAGLRPVARGTMLVGGQAPQDAVRSGMAAGAPLDPPLPPGWTLRQYVEWSARLAGRSGDPARAAADEALESLKLAALAKDRLGALTPAARRGAVMAAALATGAEVILAEDPGAGLPAEPARSFSRLVARALSDRRSVVFAARARLDAPLALSADEALVVEGSRLVAQGSPAEIAAGEGAFLVRIGGDARAFVDAMEARGGKVVSPDPSRTAADPTRAPATSPGSSASVSTMTVELGELGTLDLLRIAAGANAVVLELRPVARAFG